MMVVMTMKKKSDIPIMAEIRAILARGYSHKANESKVVDPELIEAMLEELVHSRIGFYMKFPIDYDWFAIADQDWTIKDW
jgi:hypothetical protein